GDWRSQRAIDQTGHSDRPFLADSILPRLAIRTEALRQAATLTEYEKARDYERCESAFDDDPGRRGG
ncbi:MAG: hypothetical protein MJH10_14840, partial [Epibacterium sp.]|nr:hypothetical protein [Epibacterium sp.]NQX74800.1 hypothetical protein [Epibacterium sp.]